MMEYELKIRSTATHTVRKEPPLSPINPCKKQVFQTSREGKEGKGGAKRNTGCTDHTGACAKKKP